MKGRYSLMADTVKMTFELEAEITEILRRRAREERRTLSAIVNIAIEEYDCRQSKKTPRKQLEAA